MSDLPSTQLSQQEPGVPIVVPVDQRRIRRSGVGLRAHDPSHAFDGFTLFTPGSSSGDSRTVYLIDILGTVAHTWEMPYPGSYGYLTERGTLFYNGRISNSAYPSRGSKLGVALEADWDGNILWEVQNPDQHHDGIRLRNGNVLLACYGVLPPELAACVQGGVPGTEHPWGMDGDYLQEVTTDGQVVWEWRAWEHLDPVDDGIPWPMDSRAVWTLCNGIAEWPNGDITISYRNISKVVTISRQTGEILWKLGLPLVSGQHNPTPLANGNLLIFDNGPHRLPDPEHDPEGVANATYPYSRVLELDVPSGNIVWRYQEARVSDFFSPRISSAQRLPNGNTLVNEGWFGAHEFASRHAFLSEAFHVSFSSCTGLSPAAIADLIKDFDSRKLPAGEGTVNAAAEYAAQVDAVNAQYSVPVSLHSDDPVFEPLSEFQHVALSAPGTWIRRAAVLRQACRLEPMTYSLAVTSPLFGSLPGMGDSRYQPVGEFLRRAKDAVAGVLTRVSCGLGPVRLVGPLDAHCSARTSARSPYQ